MSKSVLMGSKTDFLSKFPNFWGWRHFETQIFVKGSVADPDPGSGAFLTPGSGMGRIGDPDPG
jgi:hypothetical protein